MSAADWAEVRQLQALLQNTQQLSTVYNLAERNWVEVVGKLVELGLIEVIHTIDGNEYLTPQQLEREIRNELSDRRGRINLVELHQAIGIDFKHIEIKVNELIHRESHFELIQGELVDSGYLDQMAEEINETLQEAGQLTIAGLSKTFSFPADFVLSCIENRLGTMIHGKLDSLNRDILFTDSFVARQTSRIRGVFSAITRPTSVMSLVIEYGFQEKLFFSVIQELVSNGRLAGSIQGHLDKAVFVPEIYATTQTAWIESFFQQNGYLEYDTLSRLGIVEPKQFCLKRFGNGDILLLSTCCVGKTVADHVDASIDEAMVSESWIDIMPLLPSPCTSEDLSSFIQQVIGTRTQTSLHVFCDGRMIVSEQFVQKCLKWFEKIMAEKAQKESSAMATRPDSHTQSKVMATLISDSSDKPLTKKEQRKQKAQTGVSSSGQSGRGTGREKKTQKVKDKRKMRDEDDSVEVSSVRGQGSVVEFLSVSEIVDVLSSNEDDCPDELLQDLAEYLVK
jgi:hypothetical protein